MGMECGLRLRLRFFQVQARGLFPPRQHRGGGRGMAVSAHPSFMPSRCSRTHPSFNTTTTASMNVLMPSPSLPLPSPSPPSIPLSLSLSLNTITTACMNVLIPSPSFPFPSPSPPSLPPSLAPSLALMFPLFLAFSLPRPSLSPSLARARVLSPLSISMYFPALPAPVNETTPRRYPNGETVIDRVHLFCTVILEWREQQCVAADPAVGLPQARRSHTCTKVRTASALYRARVCVG